jgi:hypothetical protein
MLLYGVPDWINFFWISLSVLNLSISSLLLINIFIGFISGLLILFIDTLLHIYCIYVIWNSDIFNQFGFFIFLIFFYNNIYNFSINFETRKIEIKIY